MIIEIDNIKQKWFVVKIIYQIMFEKNSDKYQFDEQLRLIIATNKTEAIAKATLIGKENEEQFVNNSGEVVFWKFVGITEIMEHNHITNGTELYSQIIELDESTFKNRFNFLKNNHTNITAKA